VLGAMGWEGGEHLLSLHWQKDPVLAFMPVASSGFCVLVPQPSADPQELDLVSAFFFV